VATAIEAPSRIASPASTGTSIARRWIGLPGASSSSQIRRCDDRSASTQATPANTRPISPKMPAAPRPAEICWSSTTGTFSRRNSSTAPSRSTLRSRRKPSTAYPTTPSAKTAKNP
jgi:hypothetical protein